MTKPIRFILKGQGKPGSPHKRSQRRRVPGGSVGDEGAVPAVEAVGKVGVVQPIRGDLPTAHLLALSLHTGVHRNIRGAGVL